MSDWSAVWKVHLIAFGDTARLLRTSSTTCATLWREARGFTRGGKPSLRIPDAAFQVLPLPAYEPSMTGTLVYAEPFWRHDCVGLREVEAQAC